MVTHVAVIGAGPAGLVALRHLTSEPDKFSVVGFEQCHSVGGTWVYTDNVGADSYGNPVHSSMYKNLRTNLPKEVMAFPDFPFPSQLPSFVTHQDVRQYLEDYTEHFNIHQHIKFNAMVTDVKPSTNHQSTTWKVTYKCLDGSEYQGTETFDAVMVCNGHNSRPKIPNITGLDTFPGLVIHSHDYREPTTFRGQKVICLGAGSSGQDIAIDISPECKQVHCQVKFVLGILDGTIKLPSKDEMDGDTEREYQWRLAQGMPHKYAHTMGNLQWDYNDDLARTAHSDPIPSVIRQMYDDVTHQRSTQLMTYRYYNYELTGSDAYRVKPMPVKSWSAY